MEKIIECVPNFSEGRNKETIKAIAKSVEKTPGCTLLDVDYQGRMIANSN